MEFPLADGAPPQPGPPDQPPGGSEPPPGGPAARKGLSTGWIVALVIIAVILVGFGTCVAIVSSSGFG